MSSSNPTTRRVVVSVKEVACRYLDSNNNGRLSKWTASLDVERQLNVNAVLKEETSAQLTLEERDSYEPLHVITIPSTSSTYKVFFFTEKLGMAIEQLDIDDRTR